MRNLSRLFWVSIFLFVPFQAMADDWDKYMQLMDRFYNLDKYEYKCVTCNIEVPLTSNQVKQLHTQFDHKDNIRIKENLSEFSLTYSRNKGLTFIYPSLDISVISEESINDLEGVKKGIEIVKEGFKKQVEGTVMQLQGIFYDFQTPQKQQYKITRLEYNGTTYSATYEQEFQSKRVIPPITPRISIS